LFAFSATVTALFLRPIYKALREGGGAAQHSARYKSLLETKWMALFGVASPAVLSSTALCVNAGMFFVLGGAGTPLFANPYLDIMVFGANVGSVLNYLGMLLVCGVLNNKADCSSLVVNRVATPLPSRFTAVPEPVPVPGFVPNSQASSIYVRDEVGAF
jgi:hypothetical protein